MPVISNTSPILNLAIIGQLDLLKQQFGEILIPDVVLNELKVTEDRPGSEEILRAIKIGWLRVTPVNPSPWISILKQTLDEGEAEAIALAVDLNADWLLLDERDGRRIAKSLGLKITGILGILLRAKELGHIESLEPLIFELINKAGFRISPDLLTQVLQRK